MYERYGVKLISSQQPGLPQYYKSSVTYPNSEKEGEHWDAQSSMMVTMTVEFGHAELNTRSQRCGAARKKFNKEALAAMSLYHPTSPKLTSTRSWHHIRVLVDPVWQNFVEEARRDLNGKFVNDVDFHALATHIV